MQSGLTGESGTAGDLPYRIMSRWEMGGLDNVRAEDDGSQGTEEMWFDIVGEAEPMWNITQPRWILESGQRIMLRPARERVNIGNDPTPGDPGTPGSGQARYVWQGGFDPDHGAVEIDGRLRLWGEGTVYNTAGYPGAAHKSDQTTAQGVDFFYNTSDDLIYLYNPTGTTQQGKFHYGNINWGGGSGGVVIPVNILELDQSPSLTYLDYISFNGTTHTNVLGGLTSSSFDLVTLTLGLGDAQEKRLSFNRDTNATNVGHLNLESGTVSTTGGYGYQIDGSKLSIENNAFTWAPTTAATYDLNFKDSVRIVDDTGTTNARPVAEVQWSVAGASLPVERGLLSVNYVTTGGETQVFNVRTNGIASPSKYISETGPPGAYPAVEGTFYATGTPADAAPFVFNTDSATAPNAGVGVIEVYSGGLLRAVIGEVAEGVISNDGIRVVNTGADAYLEMEGVSAVPRKITYDDTNDRFTTDTDLAVLALSLTVGDNVTAGDPTITFDGATNDGTLAWDDDVGQLVVAGSNPFSFPGTTVAITDTAIIDYGAGSLISVLRFDGTGTIGTTVIFSGPGTSQLSLQVSAAASAFQTPEALSFSGVGIAFNASAGNEAVFNEGGLDIDVRMESDNDTDCFHLDASADGVGVGTATPGVAGLDVAKAVAFSGDVNHTLGAGDNDDLAPTGMATAAVVRLTGNATTSVLTGLAAGVDGRVVLLFNVSANTIEISDEDAGSTAANRILHGEAGNITVSQNKSVSLWYDGTSSRWRVF
jgi:hypothetical protein